MSVTNFHDCTVRLKYLIMLPPQVPEPFHSSNTCHNPPVLLGGHSSLLMSFLPRSRAGSISSPTHPRLTSHLCASQYSQPPRGIEESAKLKQTQDLLSRIRVSTLRPIPLGTAFQGVSHTHFGRSGH